MKTTFTLLIFCIPLFLLAQVVDTAAIEKQVDSLIQVSRDLTEKREFDKALEVNAEAERLALEAFGRESAAYGSCCFNRGRVYYTKSDFSASEQLYIETKTIWKRALGKEHPNYSYILNNLGILYKKMNKYDIAERYHLESLNLKKRLFGESSLEYIKSLINLGNLYAEIDKFDNSELIFVESKSLLEKIPEKNYPLYANCLNGLAGVYTNTSRYEEAETLFLESLSIKKSNKEEESSSYTSTLSNLALLYDWMGDYEKAELLYLEALASSKKVGENKSLTYSLKLENLGGFYAKMGNYQKAKSYYLESFDIRTSKINENYQDYAESLHNIGLIYMRLGDFKQAELLGLQTKKLKKKLLGKKSISHTLTLNSLGLLYEIIGKNRKSKHYHKKAKIIQSKILNIEHPKYVNTLDYLANLYFKNKKYSKAESFYTKIISTRERVLGKSHPDYASSILSLAAIYKVTGKYDKSASLFSELANLNQSLISRAVRHLSVRELDSYVQTFTKSQSQTLSFAQLPPNRNSEIVQACYDNALFYKGFLLDAAGQVKRLALADSSTTARFNLLKSYGRRLSRENDKPIAERDSASIAELEEKANDLEKELARTVAGYGEAMRQVKWQEVQQNLREGEAAVEFVHYRYYGNEKTDSVMYAALLLLPGAEQPVFIPLLEERELTQLIPDRRMRARDFVGELYTPDLYRLVWQPLESHLEGVRTVHFSPSGLLHRISFPAIPAGGALLSDRYDLQYVSSTRNLVTRQTGMDATPVTALVYGGIEYEPNTATLRLVAQADSLARLQQEVVAMETDVLGGEPAVGDAGITTPVKLGGLPYALKKAMKRSPELGERKWGPLDTTFVEMQRLERFFKSRHLFTMTLHGYEADEESFKAIGEHFPPPSILHIATHGFFFPDEPDSAMSWGTGADNLRYSDNPMRRSGIVLAGANLAWKQGITIEGRQDGILTAEEISLQNLSGTKLVVLSACETGLGDIQGSEGVYGLQRAFKKAGAENLLLTLWSIPDSKETVDFMEVFYEKWLSGGLSIREAFNEAQREIKAQYPEPYFWAGFVLVD